MKKINIFRSSKATFYERDILDALKFYTDEELANIASMGYTDIWVRGLLDEMTLSKVFPELGRTAAEHLAVMRKLIAKAAKYDLGVYVYFNEPKALPATDPFWQAHPEARGETVEWPYGKNGSEILCGLCTSCKQVQDYMYDSMYQLFKQAEGLAGSLNITASEFMSHCYSHIDVRETYIDKIMGVWKRYKDMECPRCRGRKAEEVVAELLNVINAGTKAAAPGANVIAWNWSWDMFAPDPQKEIITRLDRDILIGSDFERGAKKKVLGQIRYLDEYSLAYAGPSQKFRKVEKLVAKTGHKLLSKVQVGTTHEQASVPSLPLLFSIYKKAKRVFDSNLVGSMATWCMGNMPSVNTHAYGQALKTKNLTEQKFFEDIVLPYLQVDKPALPTLKKAWKTFARAMECYPFSIPMVYEGPVNYAPAYWIDPAPLTGKPMLESWIMREGRGDDLEPSIRPYGLKTALEGFGELSRLWQEGLAHYEKGLAGFGEKAQKELDNACVVGHVWESLYNIFNVYKICLKWDAGSCLKPYRKFAQAELENCRGLLPILQRDQRYGFHIEANGYMFDAKSVAEKIARLEKLCAE